MAEKDKKTAAEARASKLRTPEPSGSGDQGPGTQQETPSQDPAPGNERYQARMHIGNGHVAAPIEAPDAANQTDPAEGHARSSTNPISALTGVQTYTGENHVDLVDEDGNSLDPEAIFEDAAPGKTFRVAKQRVFERFNYAGTQQVFTRLLYPAGHRVGLAEAVRLADAQRLAHAQLRQEQEQVKAADKAFATPVED